MSRILALTVIAAFAGVSVAQEPNEVPPILKASDILKPELLAGPNYKVREQVPTNSGANRFSIDSEYGAFEADGNALLEIRVAEIGAIAKLKQVSKSEE